MKILHEYECQVVVIKSQKKKYFGQAFFLIRWGSFILIYAQIHGAFLVAWKVKPLLAMRETQV